MEVFVSSPPWFNSPWGNSYRQQVQNAIRRMKRWQLMRASSHASALPFEVELCCPGLQRTQSPVGFGRVGHEFVHALLADGQQREVAYLSTLHLQLVSLQEQRDLTSDYLLQLVKFLTAYQVVSHLLYAVRVILVLRIANFWDEIKALNLPKNLFPQSLRPVKAAAL